MKLEKATREHLFYGLALLLAAAIRLVGLGVPPLSDTESTWAMQALDAARGGHILLGAQPGYILLTAATFFGLGTSEFLARLWPALAGTVLVLAPYWVRERLGRGAAVVLALALALEPSLVAASRQADGRMLAITSVTFAIVFFLRGNLPWAGIGLGLTVLGGPSAWNGLVAIAFGLVGVWLTGSKTEETEIHPQQTWQTLLIWAGGTVVVLGSLFGFIPGGLSALANSLAACVGGWFGAASLGVAIQQMFTGWILLSPLAFIFGAIGIFSALRRRDRADRFLLWTWIFLFLVILIYPGRRMADLAWAAVPFLALGARQAVALGFSIELKKTILGYALLIFVLAVSIWMNVSGFSFSIQPTDETLRWSGILGALFLVASSFLLMAWGWTGRVAWIGFSYGLSAALLVFTLATARMGAGLGSQPGMELWVDGAYPSEQRLVSKVIGDVAEMDKGSRDSLDLAVSGLDTPSLRWALRNERGVKFISQLSQDARYSAIITPEMQNVDLGLSVPYTGQPLVWSQSVDWPALLQQDQAQWFFYRDLPYRPDIIKRQNIILWLRSDLFPGGAK
jgi:predicted membrane-bound mannosyltransferase